MSNGTDAYSISSLYLGTEEKKASYDNMHQAMKYRKAKSYGGIWAIMWYNGLFVGLRRSTVAHIL